MCTTIIVAVSLAGHARAAPYVPDEMSGYAIGGHDPVAYFIDGRPRKGKPSHEFLWGGVVWIFVNKGNMEAFKDAPNVYAPLFAGCDAFSLSEGYATEGNPLVFAFVQGRLLFFFSDVNRFLFLSEHDELMQRARKNAGKTGCAANRPN
ncbi:twin-arginine translocation pathway signal protein [Roseibium sp. RKSG952]|nr:twin-arginine translocation pathway signal protein [Roseibium sp. RKSG952]